MPSPPDACLGARGRLATLAWFAVSSAACDPTFHILLAEGDPCDGPTTCQERLVCVADVGAEHGRDVSADVCERPRAVYDFLHFGERGENRRVDEALDMLGGAYRLPRMPAMQPELVLVPHELTLASGVRADCGAAVISSSHVCRVPDWPAYLGDEIPKYSRFILFGLRMTAPLVYVYQHASDARLSDRVLERTGSAPSSAQLDELRRAARDAALALFDSFVSRGHVPFALPALPDCYQGSGGYLNPNASWSPALALWDPATGLVNERLGTSDDVPVDCAEPSGTTYLDLRDSLWDRHAAGYRAMSLAGAFQLFRGLLSEPRRQAWIVALKETADALALPSSYEAGNNHGITQAAALIQLGHELARLGPDAVPRASAEAWLDLGRHRASDFVNDTVFDDGVQVEQSPFYHNYQLGLMLYVARWLRATGIDIDAGIDRRYATAPSDIPPEQRRDFDASARAPLDRDVNHLQPDPELDLDGVVDRMARAASHLVQPDGWIPMIGSSLPQRFRGYMRTAFEPYLEQGHSAARELAYLWTGGEAGEAPPASDRLVSFEQSGFVTMHSDFALPLGGQTHVVFNAGLPSHRHSHADALAVHLFGQPGSGAPDQGLPLLIDSGWYSYRDVGRHYFESTSAHNTVSVDGLNQCMRTSTSKRAAPRIDAPLDACSERAARAAPGALEQAALVAPGNVVRGLTARGASNGVSWLYQSAAHSLYEGATHRRAVLLIGRAVLVVLDQLASDEPREYRQLWHITPEAAGLPPVLEPLAGTFHIHFERRPEAGGGTLFSLHEWTGAVPASAQTHDGDAPVAGVPGLGWVSTAEGQMTRHPVVELRRSAVNQATFVSVFLLGDLAAAPAELSVDEGAADGLHTQLVLPSARIDIDVSHLAHGAGPDPAGESVAISLQGAVPEGS